MCVTAPSSYQRDVVFVKLRECVRGPFHPGVVKKDNGDDTYHVTFDDGGFELKVLQSGIKAAGGGGGGGAGRRARREDEGSSKTGVREGAKVEALRKTFAVRATIEAALSEAKALEGKYGGDYSNKKKERDAAQALLKHVTKEEELVAALEGALVGSAVHAKHKEGESGGFSSGSRTSMSS